jgi:predicted nucleic acid-binding protein
MILSDTSFIIATIRADDRNHLRCRAVLATIRTPFVTTWPCITEAMHLLGSRGQETLREQIEQGLLILHVPTQQHAERACTLMRIYADSPMDFADASLVVAAEDLNITRVLTLDGHFYAYRINGNIPFDMLP